MGNFENGISIYFTDWRIKIVNLEIFLKKVDSTYQLEFDHFKQQVENDIRYYLQTVSCDDAPDDVPETGCPDEEEYENYWYQCLEISTYTVKRLYSEMGWNYVELASKMKRVHSIVADCDYYPCAVTDIWPKITECNAYEFFYAVRNLAQDFISGKTKLAQCINLSFNRALEKWIPTDLQSELKMNVTVFVAMSFSETMKLARARIKEAIEAANYIPDFIDEREHSEFIVPEIFYAIEQSAFIIVDLTEHNHGAYLEAGYALALHKPIILMCKETDSQKIHFDLQQVNQIRWKEEKDIPDLLYRRIKSIVGLNG